MFVVDEQSLPTWIRPCTTNACPFSRNDSEVAPHWHCLDELCPSLGPDDHGLPWIGRTAREAVRHAHYHERIAGKYDKLYGELRKHVLATCSSINHQRIPDNQTDFRRALMESPDVRSSVGSTNWLTRLKGGKEGQTGLELAAAMPNSMIVNLKTHQAELSLNGDVDCKCLKVKPLTRFS